MGQGYPQITPLAPLPAHRAYRPVGRSLRLGEQITQIKLKAGRGVKKYNMRESAKSSIKIGGQVRGLL